MICTFSQPFVPLHLLVVAGGSCAKIYDYLAAKSKDYLLLPVGDKLWCPLSGVEVVVVGYLSARPNNPTPSLNHGANTQGLTPKHFIGLTFVFKRSHVAKQLIN